MRRLIALAFLLALLVRAPVPAAAQGSAAEDLIAAVNELRASNSLPALAVDDILMSVAQEHSDFQASIGSVTHTGPDGSRPGNRAAAAGYGGGEPISVSENIAGEADLSPSGAVSLWQGDPLHLDTMLGSEYEDIGAGVAVSGDIVYFTIVVGSVAGPQSGPDPVEGDSPVLVGSAAADGSVTHEVQAGETLIGIAVAYGMTVAELQEMNDLGANTFIYPGDKLLIAPPFTPTPTLTPTATPTPPRPTRRPPPSPTSTPAPALALAPEADDGQGETAPNGGVESLLGDLEIETERGGLILGILVVAFLLLVSPIVAGIIRKKT
jgi:LysM repeat protein